MTKRLLSLLLALALLLTLLPRAAGPASAEDTYSGVCGDGLTWRFDPDTGVLTIEGAGCMYENTWFPWEDYKSDIRTISLPEGLVSISSCAFHYCENLTAVALPSSLEWIGEDAFSCCASLSSVSIPGSVEYISDWAFAECDALETVNLAEGVTGIGAHAFQNAAAATALELPASLCRIDSFAFYGWTSLEELTIPANLTELGNGVFGGCRSLTDIAVADGNTAFAAVDGVLFSADNKTLVQYPAGREGACAVPEGVRFIGDGAFSGCWGLLSVKLPQSLYSIGDSSFDFCLGLTEIDFPENLKRIGDGAFWGCESLRTLRFPAGLAYIADHAFADCTGLVSVELPEGIYELSQGTFMNCSALTEITIPESVEEIGRDAFYECTSLQAINFEGEPWRIGIDACYHCAALRELQLPDSVSEIETGAFAECTGLQSVTIPANLSCIDWAVFCGCTGLTEMTIPKTVQSVYGRAFADCENLAAVSFLNASCDIDDSCLEGCENVTVYGYSPSTAENFAERNGLPFVSLGTLVLDGACGDNLTWRFDPESGGLIIEGEGDMWDFWGSKGDGFITSNSEPWNELRDQIYWIELPEGLTSIGDVAFNGCWRLNSAYIPGAVTRIGAYAFGACEAMYSVEISEGVTEIGEGAFTFCTNLTALELPASVEKVETWAFSFCSGLEQIIFLNPRCLIADDCLECSENVTVYGYSPSTAEDFAEQNGLPFVSIGSLATEGVCGDDLTWRFDPETGVLSIEGEGPMYDFEPMILDYTLLPTTPWNAWRDSITALSLPEGLQTIGENAFQDCTGLTELNLPDGLEHIGLNAFAACTGLRAVQLPAGLRSVGDSAFYDCSALETLRFTEGLTSIGRESFSSCDSLTELVLPDSLKRIGEYAFAHCDALKTVTLAGDLEELGCNAFADCYKLETICLSAGFRLDYEQTPFYTFLFDYDSLWITIEPYSACEALTAFRADEANPYFSTDENGVLYNKDKSVLVSCPMGKADALTIPASVREISRGACFDCASLPAVNFEEGLIEIGMSAFSFCGRLTALQLPDSLVSVGINAFGDCGELESLRFGEGLEEIGRSAFQNCGKLSGALRFPASLCVIGPCAFSGCEALSAVEFAEGLETIGGNAFEGTGLEKLKLPESLTEIGSFAFRSCQKLRSVSLPGKTAIGADAFADCWQLRELVCRDAESMAQSLEYHSYTYGPGDTDEDLKTEDYYEDIYSYWNSLGMPESTLIFGVHDAEKEDAEPIVRNLEEEPEETYYEEYRWVENYAKTCGYRFCPIGSFSDVTENDYFELPVAWAAAMKITSGTGNGSFSPGQTCTREQIVTFLWKAAGAPEPESSENPFSDVPDDAYYRRAVLWAVENGVTKGVGANSFGVGQPCTREQAMTFLWKANGAPEPENTDSPFTDVPAGQYYTKAVLWAVENGVTKGVSADRFGVGASCTRAQIVTFLYKAFMAA